MLREGANRMFECVGLLDKTPLEVKGASAKIATGNKIKKTFLYVMQLMYMADY